MKRDLESYSTKELVEELKQREGVETKIIEPYVCLEATKIYGPATVFIVTD